MSYRFRILSALALAALLPFPARADRVTLENGQVKYGKVVEKDGEHVYLRVERAGGKLSITKKYRLIHVARIEIGDFQDPALSRKAEGSEQTAGPPPEDEKETVPPDRPTQLKAALTEAQSDRPSRGVRDLTRIVRACREDPGQLEELSDLCETETGKPLAEFLASARLREALDRKGANVRKLRITDYEKDAMLRLLRATVDEYCTKPVAGTAIDDVIQTPTDYKAKPEDARDFAVHILHTIEIVKELNRLDPPPSQPEPLRRPPQRDRRGFAPPSREGPAQDDRARGRSFAPREPEPRPPAPNRNGPPPRDLRDRQGPTDDEATSQPARPEHMGELLTKLQELWEIARRVSRGMPADPRGRLQAASRNPNAPPAPDFEVRNVRGGVLRLSDFKGRYVLLDFWATWCPPCRGEIPHLQEAFRRFGQHPRFTMISLSLDRSFEELAQFLQQNQMNWHHGYLEGQVRQGVKAAYGIHGIPQIFLIDPEGRIVERGLRGPRILQTLTSTLGAAGPTDGPNAQDAPTDRRRFRGRRR